MFLTLECNAIDEARCNAQSSGSSTKTCQCAQGTYADATNSRCKWCKFVPLSIIIYVFHLSFFHKHTKLAMLALLPTLFSHILAIFFFICNQSDVSKYEIRNQGVHEDDISRLYILLE